MHSSRMRTARSSAHLRGRSASVHAGIHTPLGLETPPGVGLKTSPPGCGPGDLPPGCRPGDPLARPLNFPLGCRSGSPPPCEQNS